MMNTKKIFSTLAAALLLALPHQAAAAIDPASVQKLVPSDGANRPERAFIFGSLSADGRTALIGSGGTIAYVFTRAADGVWTQSAKLTAANGAADKIYSLLLSADGHTALIASGGTFFNSGTANTVVVFTGSGGTWKQQATLTVADDLVSQFFGVAMSLSGDGGTALISDSGYSDYKGAAFVFTRSSSTWKQQATLTAPDNAIGAFGRTVSLSADGSTALIEKDRDVVGRAASAAYIFIRSGNVWMPQAKIDTNHYNIGGASLSADGSTAILADTTAEGSSSDSGAAFIFTRSGTAWKQQAKLAAADSSPEPECSDIVCLPAYDWFGSSMSLSSDGNTALIGTVSKNAAYVFVRSGGAWRQQSKLAPPAGAGINDFAHSVSLSLDGKTALIGSDKGAYVFTQPGI